jgi:hypothetical protein
MIDLTSRPGRPSAWQNTRALLKGRYVNWLAGMLAAILIRAIALSPLLALVLVKSGDPLQYIAILAPVLYIFVVLPLRFSFGEAMHKASQGGKFFSGKLLSLRGYGEKCKALLFQVLHSLPWTLPLVIGAVVGLYYWYVVDLATSMNLVRSLGKLLGPEYGFKEGVYMLIGAAGLLSLVFLYGLVRGGMLRFVWAQSGGNYKNARGEMLRRLRRGRFGQLLIGIVQGLLRLPVLAAEAYLGYRMFRVGSFDPLLAGLMAAAVLVLYLPLMPLLKVLQASYIELREGLK